MCRGSARGRRRLLCVNAGVGSSIFDSLIIECGVSRAQEAQKQAQWGDAAWLLISCA